MMGLDSLDALEARLADLATAIDFPKTPHFRDTVLARIRAGAMPSRGRDRWRRRVLVPLVAVITALGASLAIPQWRTTLAGWFGIHGVGIEHVPGPLPTPPPAASPTPGPPGSGLDLGVPVSLPDASRSLDFTPLVPSALGAPEAAWLRKPPAGGALSLVYLPAPGRPPAITRTGVSILVTEFQAMFDRNFLGKLAGSNTTITEVTVDGDPGVWLAGAPHDVVFLGPDGSFEDDTLRLATNTLLWQRGSVLIRIEGAQSLQQAEAIAASMR